MERVPGIAVAGWTAEEAARIEGTGIEVFEVLKVYEASGRDWQQLRDSFHWLSEGQLRAALRYAELHPKAMRERLTAESEAEASLERLWREHPDTAPKRG